MEINVGCTKKFAYQLAHDMFWMIDLLDIDRITVEQEKINTQAIVKFSKIFA